MIAMYILKFIGFAIGEDILDCGKSDISISCNLFDLWAKPDSIRYRYHQMSNKGRMLAISRINPATQKRERPWRNRAHEFSVTAPHSSREVLTQNYANALAMVQAGSSIRMSDGRGSPTLVSPLSLRISNSHRTAVDQLWFYTMPKPRFTREDLEDDIRKTIAGMAFEIFTLAGQKAADAFLGMRFDR